MNEEKEEEELNLSSGGVVVGFMETIASTVENNINAVHDTSPKLYEWK